MSLRGFLDNARREVSSMAHGAIPGLQAIGQAAVNDAYNALPGRQIQRPNGRFSLDDVVRTGANEFARSTPILPLLRGDFGEAAHRLYERPISGTLDLLGAGSVANQGLKVTSRMPGVIGTGSHRLRGYDQLDADSLGFATTIGEMPSTIKLADGTSVPGREYLLRPDIEVTKNGVFARRTMRSPRKRENFEISTGDTLADDPLVNQAVPRARYEPFAQIGDMFDFGPKIGSSRFGKRIALRNRSRLKISSQEMMAAFGKTRQDYRKAFSDLEDPDDAVGQAIFLSSAGINSWQDLESALPRFEPTSGSKAVLTDAGVDLTTTKGPVVDLSHAELDLARKWVADRDVMVENLAKRIEDAERKGHAVVATGEGSEQILTPDLVRKNPNGIYRLVGSGNLHLKRIDHTVEPERPFDQGQLFDAPVRSSKITPEITPEITPINPDQGRMFADLPANLEGSSTFTWINGQPKLKDPKTGEWVDIRSQHAAYPRSKPNPVDDLSDEQKRYINDGLNDDFDSYRLHPMEEFEANVAGRQVKPAHEWEKQGFGEIEDPTPAKPRATDEELALFQDSMEPITGEMLDEMLSKLYEKGQVIDGNDLNRIMEAAESLYYQIVPDLYEKIGHAGVSGHIYRALVEKIKGIDARNDQLSLEDFESWMAEHGESLEPVALDDTPLDLPPPREPREPKITGDADDPGLLRELRRQTAEDYSRAAWYKNYLDNLVMSRVDKDSSDIGQLLRSLYTRQDVRRVLESPEYQERILPAHKGMVAAQLEADKVRLGANALSDQNVIRNNERLSILTGKEGEGIFFVARKPRTKSTDTSPRTMGESPLEVLDDNLPGDPSELISKGLMDTSPQVHLSNYLRRKREAANQELVDTVADNASLINKTQAKGYVKEKLAAFEDDYLTPGGRKREFVIIRPNGHLFKKIEQTQPLANTAARRLREDGFYDEAENISRAAKEMFESSKDGDFSLGDMIRNPKLRGEMDDSHYMVPADMYDAIMREVTDSTNALSSFLQATSTGFKISVLHGRWPGWVVNNTIGSQIYLAMTGGLGATIPHAGAGKMVQELFPDVLGAGSREMATGAEDLGRVAQTRVDRLLDTKAGRVGTNLINTLSDWNQKIADEPARVARIEQVIEERFRATQELAKARGIEIPDTLDARRRMFQDPQIREDIAREVLDDMIDFTTLTRNERMWVSNVLPFWTFIKGSTKSTLRTMADHPGRAWLPAQVANYGAERTDEQFPQGTPEYLRSMLRVGDNQALTVGGWNPYGQQAQLSSGLLSMALAQRPTGQEHPASLVNPAITAPLEAITNRDIYTDYPLKGNLPQNLFDSALESMPLIEFLQQAIRPSEPTGRSVYNPSRHNTLLNFVGVPIRDLNEGNLAVRMSADENRRKPGGVADYWRFHDGV